MKRNDKDVEYVVGRLPSKVRALTPFCDIVIDYLDDLSKSIMKDNEAKIYPDVITFAFWCRKANILKLKERENDGSIRLGRGLVFHIAPSNVPINFAFSFVFGLLSGNANVVRMSSKDFNQCNIVCKHISKVLDLDKYGILKEQNVIIRYEHDTKITDYYSSICDVRIIWGGDTSIENIRKSPLPIRSTEIVFADRYSYGIISINSIKKASDIILDRLANNFYNDTYLMDQNACSSPHMIMWLDDVDDIVTTKEKEQIKEKFWIKVYKIAKERYQLQDIKVSDKYTLLCEKLIEEKNILDIKKYDNILYILRLGKMNESNNEKFINDITKYRGIFGMFYECEIDDIEKISEYDNKKIQTITYYGIDSNKIATTITSKSMQGIDRIVQFGEAMSIDVVWDGYEVIKMMSRVVSVR